VTQLAPQSEAQFQKAVIGFARLNNWRVAHFHDSRRQVGDRLVGDKDAAGFPDLVLARKGRVIFAELKTQIGKLKREQCEWLAELGIGGHLAPHCMTFLWRPSDWDEIAAVLR
jgi:hypothetical protein